MQYATTLRLSSSSFLAALVFLMIGAAPYQAQAQNLITQNADCVAGDGISGSWNTTTVLCSKPNIPGEPATDPGTNTVSNDETDDANGYFWANTEGDVTMFQTITGLNPGATYRFETYTATLASGSPDALVVTLQWQDGSGTDVGSPITLGDRIPANDAWEQIEQTGLVAPSGIAQAVLTVTFDDRGGVGFADVFTDEFTFEETAAAPVNSDPVFANGTSTGLTVDEDAASTSLGTQLEVDDSDAGQTLTWTVVSGPSSGTLVGFPATATSGTGVQPSGVTYEPNTDFAGSDSFEIQVSDGNGGSDNITVNVTVNNLAPVFTSATSAAFAENGTGTVLDNDATNGGAGTADDGVTYAIGGTDAGAFTIDAATGQLSFASAPDFENPVDSDGNNEYAVEVTADDGEASNNTATQTITVSVTNVTADLAIVDGSAQGLDVTATVAPGTANNTIGVFELSASLDETVLNATSITNDMPGVSGISAARLFASTDATLDVGTDTELAAIAVDNTSAPSTFDFTGFSAELTSTATYLILAIDVDADAPDDEVLFSLADASALTVPDGVIATVNGQSQTNFTSLPLANASTALPVELVTFEATPENGAVQLRWVTASETGNAGFDVQRRLETSSWSTVQRVAGAGTTTKQTTYRFADETLSYETKSVEYRLRQVDVDGGESFSSTRMVEFSNPDRIELLGTYPNPASSQITVRFAVPDRVSSAQIALFDMLGREVRTVRVASAGRSTMTMNTNDLAPGVYFLRLTGGGQAQTQKLTVVR